jgi:hypothetical protein
MGLSLRWSGLESNLWTKTFFFKFTATRETIQFNRNSTSWQKLPQVSSTEIDQRGAGQKKLTIRKMKKVAVEKSVWPDCEKFSDLGRTEGRS